MSGLPAELQAKIDYDMKYRLNEDGTPRDPANDYERHLFARYLRLQGNDKTTVWATLLTMDMPDVPRLKRSKYIDDVLDSVIVGFPNAKLPAYQEIKGG